MWAYRMHLPRLVPFGRELMPDCSQCNCKCVEGSHHSRGVPGLMLICGQHLHILGNPCDGVCDRVIGRVPIKLKLFDRGLPGHAGRLIGLCQQLLELSEACTPPVLARDSTGMREFVQSQWTLPGSVSALRNGVDVVINPAKNKISCVVTMLGPEGKLNAADPIIPSTALIPPITMASPT